MRLRDVVFCIRIHGGALRRRWLASVGLTCGFLGDGYCGLVAGLDAASVGQC
jgi:hypothetical protein